MCVPIFIFTSQLKHKQENAERHIIQLHICYVLYVLFSLTHILWHTSTFISFQVPCKRKNLGNNHVYGDGQGAGLRRGGRAGSRLHLQEADLRDRGWRRHRLLPMPQGRHLRGTSKKRQLERKIGQKVVFSGFAYPLWLSTLCTSSLL